MYLPIKIQAALVATVVLLLLSVGCTSASVSSAQQAAVQTPAADTAVQVAGPPPHPVFESTGLSATWTDPETGLNVNNDMWNCPQAACIRQEIWANSSSDWGVVSTMAKGNTAVLTYPAVQELFGENGQPAPLASARELLSTFTESMPTTSGTIGEAAYDIWLNNWNTEIMIWVDNQHQRFYDPVAGTATFNGQRFTVYVTPGKSDGYPSGPFFFVLQRNETSGTVNILAAIRWLERAGYLSASGAGINAADFGWEICSTNGVAEDFSISRYTVSVNGIQLSADSLVRTAYDSGGRRVEVRDTMAPVGAYVSSHQLPGTMTGSLPPMRSESSHRPDEPPAEEPGGHQLRFRPAAPALWG
jgi:hypothetical protein